MAKIQRLVVQWLELSTFTAVGPDSIICWGTKISQATWHGQKKKKRKRAPSVRKEMEQSYTCVHCTNGKITLKNSLAVS